MLDLADQIGERRQSQSQHRRAFGGRIVDDQVDVVAVKDRGLAPCPLVAGTACRGLQSFDLSECILVDARQMLVRVTVLREALRQGCNERAQLRFAQFAVQRLDLLNRALAQAFEFGHRLVEFAAQFAHPRRDGFAFGAGETAIVVVRQHQPVSRRAEIEAALAAFDKRQAARFAKLAQALERGFGGAVKLVLQRGPAAAIVLALEQARHRGFQIRDELRHRRLEAHAVAGSEAQSARPVGRAEIVHIGDVRRRRHRCGQPLQGALDRIAFAAARWTGDEYVVAGLCHAGAEMQRAHGAVLTHRAGRLGKFGRRLERQPRRIGYQPQRLGPQGLQAHPHPMRAAPHLFGTLGLLRQGVLQTPRRLAPEPGLG